MGLAETQRALARLYTDADIRERFFTDPRAGAASLGLSEDEAGALASVERDRLGSFARSLIGKRLSAVASLVPLTAAALDRDFGPLFRAHAREYLPRGTKKHREDALAFLRFLENHTELPSRRVLDTAHYEACWLLISEPRSRLLVRLLRFAPPLTGRARPGAQLTPLGAAPTVAVWIRAGGSIYHWLLPRPRNRARPTAQYLR
jgi:hypothetical protein